MNQPSAAPSIPPSQALMAAKITIQYPITPASMLKSWNHPRNVPVKYTPRNTETPLKNGRVPAPPVTAIHFMP